MSRLIATDLTGLSACLEAHASICARSSGDSLIAVTGFCPVAGRPGFRFRTTFLLDGFI